MHRAVLRALRAIEIDVVSAVEAGRTGLVDEEQLRLATLEGRTVYTSNVPDFTRLHRDWLRAGLHHAGIIVLIDQRMPIGTQVAALTRLVRTLEPDAMRDRLEFLSNWHE